MEKMVLLRSTYRSVRIGSYRFAAPAAVNRHLYGARSLFSPSSSSVQTPLQRLPCDCRSPFALGIGSSRTFSDDVSHMPDIKDPDVLYVFKDLMAASWDELPDAVIHDAKKALSKNTDDKTGQEILANVFRAAEAVEEFCGIIISLKMELDDSIGMSGENVQPLSDEYFDALSTIFTRYIIYLGSFEPEEEYLRKKVETELGSKMIYLKMRCANIGSWWGKISVLGTSGLSGSYIEKRA